MLHRVSSCVFDVIEGLLRIHLISFCNFADSLGAESTLGVDVDHLAISPAFFFGQLSSYTESVCQLCFASPKLPEGLSDGHGLDASAK